MKFSFRLLPLACLGLLSLVVCAVAQSGPAYDALVQQGKTQLQAGDNDAALTSANAAIKANADRWEAYAVAGGAMMNLKRYEEAADEFSHAIDHAPAEKQEGLRDLRKQCLLAETQATPVPSETHAPIMGNEASSGPSYADTVKWIRGKFEKVGMPGFKIKVKNPVTGTYDPDDNHAVANDITFTAEFDSCNMKMTSATSGSDQDTKTTDTLVYTVPLDRVVGVSSGVSKMYRVLAVSVVTDTNAVSWSRTMWDSDSGSQSAQGKLSRVEIPFGLPGTQDIPPHMITALQHLSTICKSDPNQGSKELF